MRSIALLVALACARPAPPVEPTAEVLTPTPAAPAEPADPDGALERVQSVELAEAAPDELLDAYEDYLTVVPDGEESDRVRFAAGVLYARLGEDGAALGHLGRLVDDSPDGPYAGEAALLILAILENAGRDAELADEVVRLRDDPELLLDDEQRAAFDDVAHGAALVHARRLEALGDLRGCPEYEELDEIALAADCYERLGRPDEARRVRDR